MSKRPSNLKKSSEELPSKANIKPVKFSNKSRKTSKKEEVPEFDEEEYIYDEEADMDALIETLSGKLKFHVFNPDNYEIETHRNILIVPPDYRKTSEVMTEYEYCEVISHRAKQIENGSPVFVDVGDETDPIVMARLEVLKKKCPLAIRRVHNNLIAEIWHCYEMSIP